MPSDSRIRAYVGIIGLCAAFGLAACGSTPPEGSSEPVGEEMFGGDNRDMAPAHQEKMREREEG